MRTVSIDTHEEGQVVRLPADMAYEGVEALAISREGDVVILRPVRPSWMTYLELPKAEDEYLQERPVVMTVYDGRHG